MYEFIFFAVIMYEFIYFLQCKIKAASASWEHTASRPRPNVRVACSSPDS